MKFPQGFISVLFPLLNGKHQYMQSVCLSLCEGLTDCAANGPKECQQGELKAKQLEGKKRSIPQSFLQSSYVHACKWVDRGSIPMYGGKSSAWLHLHTHTWMHKLLSLAILTLYSQHSQTGCNIWFCAIAQHRHRVS